MNTEFDNLTDKGVQRSNLAYRLERRVELQRLINLETRAPNDFTELTKDFLAYFLKLVRSVWFSEVD